MIGGRVGVFAAGREDGNLPKEASAGEVSSFLEAVNAQNARYANGKRNLTKSSGFSRTRPKKDFWSAYPPESAPFWSGAGPTRAGL